MKLVNQPSVGPWSWAGDTGTVHLRFLGRGTASQVEELHRSLTPRPRDLGWLYQIHSGHVLQATIGRVGEGDALVTSRSDLALVIATADCVPILLSVSGQSGSGQVAAIHAGWRGLVAGVIGATLEHLEAPAPRVEAWIGPAIGVCCYEVGDDVAAKLRQVGNGDAVISAHVGNPKADLQAIARHQLAAAGVRQIQTVELCTRCNPDLLWSYRRDGDAAGRNWAVVWRGEVAS